MAEKTVKLKVNKESFYGTGKRKSSIARVWILPGSGKITVNDRASDAYFGQDILVTLAQSPLVKLGINQKYDVKATCKGGGIVGQAGAVRHGVARALLEMNPEFRKALKEEGFLTRDPRVKERKKYGRKKARKGYQFRKR